LINEVDYTIKPTTIPHQFERLTKPGAFFRAKIIPVSDNECIFSGTQEFLDISEKEVLKVVASFQMKHPELAFRDNTADGVRQPRGRFVVRLQAVRHFRFRTPFANS